MLKIGKGAVRRNRLLYNLADLEIESGQVIGLIGANGAGKSTFFDELVGGGVASFEQLSWNGMDLQLMNAQDRSQTIALVESKFLGVPYMNVLEYVSLGRAPWTNSLGKMSAYDISIVHQMLDRMCVGHLAEQDTTTLSDGERQRASVARALVQETPLILLDEPTAFLDYLNKEQLMQTLVSIAEEKNKLILLSSHDLELVLKYTNGLLVIEQAKKQLNVYPTNAVQLNELLFKAFSS